MDWIKWIIQSLFWLITSSIVIILGLFIFPIAWLFRYNANNDRIAAYGISPYSKEMDWLSREKFSTEKEWEEFRRNAKAYYVHEEWHLPKWAYWWDNISDDAIYGSMHWQNYGMMKNHNEEDPGEHKFYTRFIDAYWWAALRNPANGFKRGFMGINKIYSVKVVAGKDGDVSAKRGNYGWHLLKARTDKGTKYWFTYQTEKRDIRIGFKLKIQDKLDSVKYPVGFTFRIK